MDAKLIHGNIFTTKCQTIVNTVNCYGVMGAGIALECKLRYPDMFERYQYLCENQLIDIGRLFLFKKSEKWILNFPTKKHWKFSSKLGYVEAGLIKFKESYAEKEINSVAFPILGTSNGGLEENEVLDLMYGYLNNLNIDVEIYKYNPTFRDDYIDKLESDFASAAIADIKDRYKLRNKQYEILARQLSNKKISTVVSILKLKGFSERSVINIFTHLAENQLNSKNSQLSLFNE